MIRQRIRWRRTFWALYGNHDDNSDGATVACYLGGDHKAARRYHTLAGRQRPTSRSRRTRLTDATLLMFDKMMGSLSRKAERKSQEKAASAVRDVQEKLRISPGPAPP
jgi:hypothetical protein